MLPLGRKNARKCSECDITCHANCAHLVPDFCGMSMETANELLRNWRDINKLRGDKVAKPPRQYAEPSHTTSPSLDASMGAMKIIGLDSGLPSMDPFGRPSSVPPPSERYQDPRQYQQQQLPPQPQAPPYGSQQPLNRPPPGARVPIPPGYPQEPVQPRVSGTYDVSSPAVGDGGYTPGGYQVFC